MGSILAFSSRLPKVQTELEVVEVVSLVVVLCPVGLDPVHLELVSLVSATLNTVGFDSVGLDLVGFGSVALGSGGCGSIDFGLGSSGTAGTVLQDDLSASLQPMLTPRESGIFVRGAKTEAGGRFQLET